MRSPANIALFKAVRTILLDEWDPIGIVAIGGPQDEYDSYIWPLIAMLRRRANATELSAHLAEIASDRIGITTRHDDAAVASTVERLLALPIQQTD